MGIIVATCKFLIYLLPISENSDDYQRLQSNLKTNIKKKVVN